MQQGLGRAAAASVAAAASLVLAAGLAAAASFPTAVPAAPAATTAAPAPVVTALRPVGRPVVAEPPAPVAAAPAPVAAPAPPARATRAKAPAPRRQVARRVAAPSCAGGSSPEARGRAALASLRAPQVAQQVSVTFLPGRSDVLGLADLQSRRVRVFVRSCAQESDALLRHVMGHELGHVVDGVRMTADSRSSYLAARGIAAGTPWFGCDRCTDFQTPAGDFAETYAQWQRGATSSRSQLARPATRAELDRLAQAFFA